MAEGAPGAFIPGDTVVAVPRKNAGALNDLLLLSSIVLLVASVALAAAVFLYQQFLATESASKLEQLQRAKAAFEPSLIQELTRLDDRMHVADELLGMHVAPSSLFRALEKSTLSTVSFQALTLDANEFTHITLQVQGVAESVNSIALQGDVFSKGGVITNPIFSGITRQGGGVHFDLMATINPAAVRYAPASAAVAPTAQPAAQQSPQNSSSPFGLPSQAQGGNGGQQQEAEKSAP